MPLPKISFCGINFNNRKWSKHLYLCKICGEQWKIYRKEESNKLLLDWKNNCECGCGKPAPYNKKFRQGHNKERFTPARIEKIKKYLINKEKLWKKDEIKKLTDLYCNKGLGAPEIAKILGRSVNAIHIKQTRLKLRHTKKQRFDLKSRNTTGTNNPMSGKISPNKGLTKSNCERIKIASEKISKVMKIKYNSSILSTKGEKNGMWGKSAWNKGLTKETDERLMSNSVTAPTVKTVGFFKSGPIEESVA